MTDFAPTPDMAMPPGPAGITIPPPPDAILGELAKARRDHDPTSGVLDPGVGPKDRLLTGAAVYTGSPGAARADYAQWRLDRINTRSTPTPQRRGISSKQATMLVAPDDKAHIARTIAGKEQSRLAGFLAMYEKGAGPAAPVDIARFDRAVSENKVTGRASVLYTKARDGTINDVEANELGAQVDRVTRLLDAFDDDLTLAGAKLLAVDTTEVEPRLRVAYTLTAAADEGLTAPSAAAPLNAPGALSALPGEQLPPSALSGKVSGELTLDIGATDATFIAKVNPDTDALNRRGYPAAIGDDGTPRWLRVAAAHLHDVNVVERSAMRTPNAVVETHQHYAGLFPYDSIVFEHPSVRLPPQIAALGAKTLGRGLSDEPTVGGERIRNDELVDAETVRQHLHETQWAIFTDPAPKLNAKYDRIPVTSGERAGTLVFGISPGEALDASPGLVYLNDGVAIRSGNLDTDDVDDDEWDVTPVDGETVSFSPTTEQSLARVERRQRSVERFHIPITEDNRPHVDGIVVDLELRGGRNPVVYTSIPTLDGFERAREHVYTDGTGGYKIARTADSVLGDPNAIPVWVRRVDGLPGSWVPVPPEAHDTGMEELLSERVAGKYRFDARDSPDLGAPVRTAHTVAQRWGYDAVEVIGPGGKVQLARPQR